MSESLESTHPIQQCSSINSIKKNLIDNLIPTASVMATVTPMLELSKKYMDPTGGEIMDVVIAKIPILTNALGNNDVTAIRQILSDQQKSMRSITSHITHPEVRKTFFERIDAFHSVVLCMNQGKCGFKAYFHYMSGCVAPLKKLFTSLSN